MAVSRDILAVLRQYQGKRVWNPYHLVWEMYFEMRDGPFLSTLANRLPSCNCHEAWRLQM